MTQSSVSVGAYGCDGQTESFQEAAVHTVAILGAGPVGLWAAFMSGMHQLDCCLVDTLDQVGGQCQALYPDKPIYDIPGCPSIPAGQLVQQLQEQVAPFRPTLYLGQTAESVVMVREDPVLFEIRTSAGALIRCRAIVVCGGAGALIPKRPPLPQIQDFEGQSVHYFVPSGMLWENKTIVVAGGGDSAIDWTLLLAHGNNQVHLVHRREQFSAQPHSVEQLYALVQSNRVTLHTCSQLHALEGGDRQLTHVHIRHAQGDVRVVNADILLPCFGMHCDLGPLGQWGLVTENQRIVINPMTGETNIPGIYAAGDIAIYPHKLKLIMTGWAEVAQAVHHLKSYLFPDQFIPFRHSTSMGSPHGWNAS